MPIEEDVELDEDQKEPPKKRSVKKIIIFTLLGLLIIGGGAAAGLYFTGHLPLGEHDSAEADSADSATEGDKKKGKKGKKNKDGKKGKKAKEELKPAIYLPLEPPFVVNFQDQTHARFLQVTIEVMARDQLVIDAVKTHMPLIRNNLLLLLSSQTYETVTTREGKDKIRTDTLAEIQKVMTEETGDPGVEGVYFTSFVMQ